MTMELNASRDTVQAIAEVLKYASFLDDRIGGADQGRIAAWSEQVERHGLGREDLLGGLQRYYDSPHDRAIGVGDLITHARAARRDRTEREERDVQERRAEDVWNRKAADTEALAATFVPGPVTTTSRLDAARAALQTCYGRDECLGAIREYSAAKAQAGKR